ncbi:MAG: MATE efflux family protein [Dehalococcoidia bacterium]|nr:MATE efflux family protein [Dehalococcoidia bacterium]
MPGQVSTSRVQSVTQLIKQWNWGLFLLIFLYMALPQFYRSYSIYLIGNAIPDTNALATVAQWQFIELLIEVVQETFVLAIFFFVGKGIQSKEGPGYTIRTSLTTIFLFSTVIAGVLFSLSSHFVAIIGTPKEIQATTETFLKIKTASMPILLMSTASVMIIETINRRKWILTLAILQVVYRFIFDSAFYGGYSFSLNLGVLGVAWSDLAASLTLFLSVLLMIRVPLTNKLRHWWSLFSFKDWKTYMGVGAWSGLDSLVRNFAYFFMIIRLLNLLGTDAIGGYYLAMHIIWSFLLVPVLALAETTKVLIANHSLNIQKVRSLWYSALIVGAVVLLIWLVLLPFWQGFASLLSTNGEVVKVSLEAMTILIIPYMLLALNLVTDAIFYGVGKTKYMAYQAIITNGTVYVVAFIAYITKLWTPTFTSILVLFSIGILVDSILTVYYASRVLYPKYRALRTATVSTED